jgi:hypothetical protein
MMAVVPSSAPFPRKRKKFFFIAAKSRILSKSA